MVSSAEIFAVLRQYNPWWSGRPVQDLPQWRRAAFKELTLWITNPPAKRALLLSGARQVGKTTLFLQAINHLLETGVSPNCILYITFDHPLLKQLSLDDLLGLWDEFEPQREGVEYLFLDEIQSIKDWQIWLKHQVDFKKQCRIAVTGSAMSLKAEKQESGVGRWHTIQLTPLTFYEYIQIRKIQVPNMPEIKSLTELFSQPKAWYAKTGEENRFLTGVFHEYLLRGGFPQCTQIENISTAQKLLREDIIDKILKRDMTAVYGVRRVLELEQTFLYLCLHDGGLLDLPDLCKNLEVKKPTVTNFILLLEDTHLIYRLYPFGYGKEILRAKPKIYLADPSIVPSVLLKGKELFEDAVLMGQAVETAFFKHLFSRYYRRTIGFSYWRGKKEQEVDIIATIDGELVPFEVKYRNSLIDQGKLKGLSEFSNERAVKRAYVITKDAADFEETKLGGNDTTRLLKIPAPLACYWLGQSESLGMTD